MTTTPEALIERFDHLRNSGVCSPTTRGLLDDAEALITALYTPSAAPEGNFDVREALVAEARALIASRTDVEWAEFRIDLVRRLADAAEVRPHATVPAEQISDAEVEAAARALYGGPAFSVGQETRIRAALEAAREVRNAAHRP